MTEEPQLDKETMSDLVICDKGGDCENLTYLSAEDLLREAQKQTDNKYVQVNISRALELLEDE